MCHGKWRLPPACRSCISSARPWTLPSNTLKRIFTRKSTHWAIPKRRCLGFVWPWWPTMYWRWCWQHCGAYGQEKIDQEVSLYYVANEIATTYTGMMIAIPEPEWSVFSTMSTPELAKVLVDLAQHVRLEAFRKSPTRARKTRSHPKRLSKKGHVSTAKLLKSRKAQATAP